MSLRREAYLRRIIVVLTVVGLGCAACSSSSTLIGDSNGGAGQDSAADPTDRARGDAVQLDGTRPDGGVFYVDETTVYVSFPGGRIGDIENDYCASQYEMIADETERDVSVMVFRVVPASPPAETPCEAAQHYPLVSVELDDPLGDRTLSTGSHVVNPAFVDQRLEPTWIPDGWTERDNSIHDVRGGYLRVGKVAVEIQAMADEPGVDIVRGNALHENIDILGVGDGAVVTRASTGVHRLGFDDAGWFYDFIAQPGVDRDELIKFARGFGNPFIAFDDLYEPTAEMIDQVQLALGLDEQTARTRAQMQMVASDLRADLRRIDPGYMALAVEDDGLLYASTSDDRFVLGLFDDDVWRVLTVQRALFTETELGDQVRAASTLARDGGFMAGEFWVTSSSFPAGVTIAISEELDDARSRADALEQSVADHDGPPITVILGPQREHLQGQSSD